MIGARQGIIVYLHTLKQAKMLENLEIFIMYQRN